MGKRFLLLIVALALFVGARSQDIQFSQFYSAPLYLNPAFAGSAEVTRVGLNFRNQWPALDQSFYAFSVYADHFVPEKNSGIGLIVNGSRESLANLQNTDIGLIYSYRLRLGNYSYLHMGIQGSYGTRSAAFDEAILGTQLDIDRGLVNPGGGSALPDDRQRSFGDLSAGILYLGKKTWLGFASHHLTQPNVSYLALDRDVLPIRYSLHGGYKFDLTSGSINDFFNNTEQSRTFSLAFNYKSQGQYDQLDIGSELFFEPLILGLWYRGLPSWNGLPNNEAIIAVLGFSFASGMDLGYSYDFTISKLGWRNSGGAHEISIRYTFVEQLWKRKVQRRLPTFRF